MFCYLNILNTAKIKTTLRQAFFIVHTNIIVDFVKNTDIKRTIGLHRHFMSNSNLKSKKAKTLSTVVERKLSLEFLLVNFSCKQVAYV